MEQRYTASEWGDMYEHYLNATWRELVNEGVIDVEALYAATNPTVAVMLTDNGERRILVIKTIREFTGLGLIPAKGFTDDVQEGNSATLMVTGDYGHARRFSAALRNAGATVHIEGYHA